MLLRGTLSLRPFVLLVICARLGFAGEVTFTRDVAPVLYRHCAGCHHPGDIAPMSLLTYKEVRPWAAAIREAVLTRKMPPWKADPRYGEWSNDPRLSDGEIATLKAWADGSKPEGNLQDMPAAPNFHDGWKIGKPDLVLSIPEYKLAAGQTDDYSNVDVPTHFQEDRWIVAAELRPGNRRVVHHAHVFVKEDSPKATAAKDPVADYVRWLVVHEGTLQWMRPDAPVIDDGCSVDDNGLMPGRKLTEMENLLSSYLPGRDAERFPEGTARKIPAGATLNFRIHYSRTTGKPETDTTSVGLIFAKEPPQRILYYTYISNQMFRIPPGDPDHPVSGCHTFDRDLEIMSLTPHMHLRGKAMRYIARYPDGHQRTLLYVPAYDFNWQFTYHAKEPIRIPKGTRIEVMGEFDNSANNPLNPDPKKAIRWGSASEMEMMDGWVEYVEARPGSNVGDSSTNWDK
jgi:hypothetical protein